MKSCNFTVIFIKNPELGLDNIYLDLRFEIGKVVQILSQGHQKMSMIPKFL